MKKISPLPMTVQNFLAIERGLVTFVRNEQAWKDGGGNEKGGVVRMDEDDDKRRIRKLEEVVAGPGGAGKVGDGDLRAPGELDEASRQSFRETTSKLWGLLRQARVFDFHPMTYGIVYHECDVYTTEQLFGQPWKVGDVEAAKVAALGGKPLDFDFDPVAYVKCLQENGTDLPLPDKFAFPVMYLGYDHGLGMTDVQYGWRFGRTMKADDVAFTALVGHLIDFQGGRVYEFLMTTTATTGDTHMRFFPLMTDRKWTCPESLAPWTISAMIHLINGYRRFVVDAGGFGLTYEYTALAKKRYNHRKAVPPPFYTLHLKDETVREHAQHTVRTRSKAQKPEHRYDVRGHERIRVDRGTLPLDEKKRHRLTKRKYRIFTIEPLDEETWRLLAERRMPGKRPGEWVAVKRSWIDSFFKGPEGAPYIPAVRKVPKRRRVA